jgi:hypothetical protein
MMKIYEILAWSSVTAFDKAFFFEIEASDRAGALAKFAEVAESQEYSWRKLRLERIEAREDRLARLADLGLV